MGIERGGVYIVKGTARGTDLLKTGKVDEMLEDPWI